MHISEGILPLAWAATTTVSALPFVGSGARRMQTECTKEPSTKPLYGLVGAAVFVISALPIPVPISGTCAHPTGIGMASILVKPLPAAAITGVVLLLQALFMAHGGLSTWGANTLHMGVAGAFASYWVFHVLLRLRLPLWASAGVAGAVADLATYGATAMTMGLALHGERSWLPVAGAVFVAFLPTQIPLAILEGALTAGMVTFVAGRRPDIAWRLDLLGAASSSAGTGAVSTAAPVPVEGPRPGKGRWLWLAILALPALILFSALRGDTDWEGVDVSVVGYYAAELGREALDPVINVQGDLLLFVFTVAGAIGGFLIGYFWRGLFDRRRRSRDPSQVAVEE